MLINLDLLTLMEEHRLRVFENGVLSSVFGVLSSVFGVLSSVFGPHKEGVPGWRQLYNEGRRDIYSSSDTKVSKWRMRWVEHVARMGKRYAYTVYCTPIQKRVKFCSIFVYFNLSLAVRISNTLRFN